VAISTPEPEPAAAPEKPASDGDTIIVTGTRATGRTVTSSAVPIDVLSKADLQTSGKQSTRDLLGTLVPSINVSNAGSGASFAVKTLSLRGLSSDEVLVLVNGKRRHNTATMFINGTTQSGQSPPDLDLIASNAIGRVEVLRDGAAAQYGSDAIAGVINIVLKNDTTGSASLLGGATGSGDGVQGRMQLDKGFRLGAGTLHLSAEAYNQGHTYRSGINTLVNQFTNMGGQPGAVGANGAINFEMPVGEAATLYSFDTASVRQADGWLTYRTPTAVTNYTTLFPNGYSPHLFLTDYDYQASLGIKGTGPAQIKYDLSTTYSDDRVEYEEKSALNVSLGPTGPTSFYIGKLGTSEWTTNLDLSRPVDIGLVEPVLVALGAEYRRDTFTIGAGDPSSYINGGYVSTTGPYAGVMRAVGSQGVNGFPASSAGSWSRNAWSVYANLEGKIIQGVELGLAGRHEHYSDFGDTSTGKVSLRLEPVRGFALRGTASTGFRAPTLQQEHYSSASTISVNGVLLPVSALPVDTPAAIALGAKPLKPERSTNFSVGMVFTAIPRLTVTVDAYQIRIRDRILLSETLQGNTVLSVLQSAGILNSAGGFYFSNAASTRTRGLDVVATYRVPETKLGSFNLSLSANLNKTVFTHIDDLPDVLKNAGLVLIGRSARGFHARDPAFQDHRQRQLEQGRLHRHGARHALWLGHPDLQLLSRHRRLCRGARCRCHPQDAGGSGAGLSAYEGYQDHGGREQSVQHLSRQTAGLAAVLGLLALQPLCALWIFGRFLLRAHQFQLLMPLRAVDYRREQGHNALLHRPLSLPIGQAPVARRCRMIGVACIHDVVGLAAYARTTGRPCTRTLRLASWYNQYSNQLS
jgi:iron complex outermembrane receptor protein